MKILVLGPVASGKSTLAYKISEKYNIPVYEIDNIVHDDLNHIKRSQKEQTKMINDIIRNQKEWIIEGMPRTHLDLLASNATIIIYLDFSKSVLKRRLKLRHLKYKLGITKVDFDTDFELYQRMLEYILNDNKENLYNCMKRYPAKLVIIKSNREIKKFFSAVDEGHILKYQ